MPPTPLHADDVAADEVTIDDALARQLLGSQSPALADLPLARVPSGGTENAVFRVGDRLALRMPRQPDAVAGLVKEMRWVPVLARHLSLEVPEFLTVGEATADYPFPWAVVRWLEGRDGLAVPIHELRGAAATLTELVTQLQGIDTTHAPAPGSEGFTRGLPLAGRDQGVRESLLRCAGLLDTDRVGRVWEDALAAPAWEGRPVWLHADLIPGNVLVRGGRLTGVIDFGAMATGDPAYDVTAAWHLLDPADRARFLDHVGADEATRRRARGVVVAHAVAALPHYLHTNQAMVATSRRGIEQVLLDRW